MPGVCSSICTIGDSGAEANTSASMSPASSADHGRRLGCRSSVIVAGSMRLASSSLLHQHGHAAARRADVELPARQLRQARRGPALHQPLRRRPRGRTATPARRTGCRATPGRRRRPPRRRRRRRVGAALHEGEVDARVRVAQQRQALQMSAIGGEADIIQGKADSKECPLMTQSGHQPLCRRKACRSFNCSSLSRYDLLSLASGQETARVHIDFWAGCSAALILLTGSATAQNNPLIQPDALT